MKATTTMMMMTTIIIIITRRLYIVVPIYINIHIARLTEVYTRNYISVCATEKYYEDEDGISKG